MQIRKKATSTITISFSGIDGAGKTTQIQSLCAYLLRHRVSFKLVTFWDEVARFTWFRESAGYAVFGGDHGVGTPTAPINRKDKNVRSRFMTFVRFFLYLADALALRQLIEDSNALGVDVLIFDRFIDDELANLSVQNRIVRVFIRSLAKLVPLPAIKFLVDADPVAARSRKPEYPLEFLEQNRMSYFALNDLIGGFTIVGPAPIREIELKIQRIVAECLTIALLECADISDDRSSRIAS